MESARSDERSQSRRRTKRDAGAIRIFGRELDRLTVRLALGVALVVVVALGLGFYGLSRHHFEQALQTQRQGAETQTHILEVALRHQMMDQDRTLMASILGEIGAQPQVLSAMILDHEGEVRVSSRPEDVGTRIPRESKACLVCHTKEADERDLWVVTQEAGESVLRNVLPIENRKECHACHSPEKRLNGILILDTSLGEVRAELKRDTIWFVAGTAALALLLLGGIGFFMRQLVLTRLAQLGRAARSIAAGNLGERTRVRGDDVIGSLATDFDDMADTVSRLVGEVREQEAQLTSIMNSLDDGLVVLDRDSRVVASNRSFCRRVETHPESLRGRRCRGPTGGLMPCCREGADCPAERCISTGRVQRAVFQHGSPGAAGRTVEEVYASPVFDEEGQVVQVVEIWRDISQRVEEEERLAEIERLVSLGTLASGFSHEVNTPLASVLTCAESVLAQVGEHGTGEDPEPLLAIVREHAGTIRDQVLRCRRITEQFLRFSRGVPPSLEPVDLGRVVAQVATLVRPTAREAGVRLQLPSNGSLPAVRANAEVVQHVVLNLLVNAIQSFDGGGGSVELGFEVDDEVRLWIRDDGCGIPEEGRAHLFEPFRSRKAGGTGLGLFLSRSFMRRFGGDVRLRASRVGEGSCFEILFARAVLEPT